MGEGEGVGLVEEPGTLAQGAPVRFPLVPLVRESNPKLQSARARLNYQPIMIGDLEPIQNHLYTATPCVSVSQVPGVRDSSAWRQASGKIDHERPVLGR